MTKKTLAELQVRYREIQDRMGAINENAAKNNNELKEEEQREWNALVREASLIKIEQQGLMSEEQLAKQREVVSMGEQLREYLKNCRNGKAEREILLNPASGNVTANIAASGAINLTIHEMIPTLHEGLDLPESLRIVTGVTGDEVWPVSINDVEMEEADEVEALSDQVLDFSKINPTKRRVGLTVGISNMAIDEASFDLLGFVQAKFTLALKIYLAKKMYSQANWNGNKGPFSNLAKAGDINLGDGAYASVLKAIAKFSDKGFFEGDAVLIMDRETEAELMATPRAGNMNGFVIENGLCAGHPYICSHFINTKLNGGGTALEATAKKYIGIGYFEWFALQQHGEVHMITDIFTGAKKNVTQITLNTAWSMTDLSKKINGANNVTQAFALYEVVPASSTAEF